jgi:hypothetical protein
VHTVSLLSDLVEVPFALNNEVYVPKDEAQSSPTGPNDDDKNVDINDDTVVLDTMHLHLTSPLYSTGIALFWTGQRSSMHYVQVIVFFALLVNKSRQTSGVDGNGIGRGSSPRFVKISNGPNTNSEYSNLLN